MTFVTLRRAGGSLVLTIPKAHARSLGLTEGALIGVTVEDGKLVGDPAAKPRPRYRLDDLVAQCDPAAAIDADDGPWLAGRPVGGEAL